MPSAPLILFIGFISLCGRMMTSAAESKHFTNPLREGADPWVVRDESGARWLWCAAENAEKIVIRTTSTLTEAGTEHSIWQAPAAGPASGQVWAPELHFLDGRWFIYFSASDGRNETHRALVLRSDTADPLGSWTLHGPLATGGGTDGNHPAIWAIDMTILHHAGFRYAVWSGWDTPESDRQFLYIARMVSPTELAGPRALICRNDDYLWERTEEIPGSRGLNEGPQVLQHSGRIFLLYSCGAAWLPTYKVGLLELTGSDPLDPEAWRKHPQPVFQSTESTFGVGHSCFVSIGTPATWWHVYHAKRERAPGWPRSIFLQPFQFDESGFPEFGRPLPPGSKLAVPVEVGRKPDPTR